MSFLELQAKSNIFLHASIIKSQFGSSGSDNDAAAASPFLATRKHQLSISGGAAGVEEDSETATAPRDAQFAARTRSLDPLRSR